jgi:hypothetical protein
MIKAVVTVDGRKLLLLGLSFGNLDKFKREPGDTFIRIDGQALGLPIDVMIYSGETEQDCAASIVRVVGQPLGPTGDFPQGKHNADDEGGLTTAIATEGDKVVIRFGKEVAWIGFDADRALAFADVIAEHAQAIKRRRSPPCAPSRS